MPQSAGWPTGRWSSFLIFAALFLFSLLLHGPLLRLPYFWDEAGYYIPAARDVLLTGSLIPRSTPSNAHPPLVMAYLALCWKIFGFAPVVTRVAMLGITAFSLLGIFRLAERIANTEVAMVSTLLTAIYPVFFTQSSLAQIDLAAAGLIFWGLGSYVRDEPKMAAAWFSLAALAKETAILVPLALVAWEILRRLIRLKANAAERGKINFSLLLPLIPLSLWYAYHYRSTGYVFGNPEFFHYNVQATLQPLRIVLAFGLRLFQVFGYMNLALLTLAALLAMWLPPRHDDHGERPRIAVDVQLAFLSIVVVYSLAMSVIGGAVLARYMLPVVPLVIIVCVSTLCRRAPLWRVVLAVVGLAFVAGLFVNPPYGFSIEDNLAYRDYIVMHQHAEQFLETRYPKARVLTAWPASDELTHPYLGYITRPLRVVRMENFTLEELTAAANLPSGYDVALVFSSKYEPPFLARLGIWQEWKKRFFGYYRDVPPAAAAQILGGHLVYTEARQGQWVGVIEMEQIMEASR